MEALAIVGSAASILQLIDTAAKLSIQLYSFASTLGEAEEEINAVALEISLFANTLDQLRTLFEKEDAQYSAAVLQNTENVVRSCRDIFSRYETLLKHLINSSEEENGVPVSISLSKTSRVKWAFKQKRVEVLRRRLAALQTNLLAMLHTLTLSELQSLRSLVSQELKRQAAMKEQVLRSYIMANRVSISSLEEAEKDAELATDESDLVPLQDEMVVRCILDDTDMLQSPTKRDSIWLLAAVPDVSSPSSQFPNETSGEPKAESSLPRQSIPEVQDFVSRYSVILDSDGQQPSQSDSMTNGNEDFSKSRVLPALQQVEDTGIGRKRIERQMLGRSLAKDRRKFAIHPALPFSNEGETPCELPDIENFEGILAALKDRKYLAFFDELYDIEKWFRVLSSDERLAALHSCLDRLGYNQLTPYTTCYGISGTSMTFVVSTSAHFKISTRRRFALL